MMTCKIEMPGGLTWTTYEPVGGLDEERITLRRNDESGAVVFGYGTALVFTGVDAQYIKNVLVSDPLSCQNFLYIHLIEDCCTPAKDFKFLLSSQNIEWCENDCTITGNLTEYTDDNRLYQCVKSTLVSDNYVHSGLFAEFPAGTRFQDKHHPRVANCNELRPAWWHEVVLILGIMIELIYFTIVPIVALISAIINLISILSALINGTQWTAANDAMVQYMQWKSELDNWLTNCGHYHPSPFVRDYISNVCEKCGLSWSSTILGHNDYWRMVYWNAPSGKGPREDENYNWLKSNDPNLSLAQFLDQLNTVFNAEWRIINGHLYFEQAIYFKNQSPWLVWQNLDPAVSTLCWKWSKVTKPAYGDFSYAEDAIDSIGNEAKDRYNDIVEWNSPPSPVQSGVLKVEVPFGAARFRNDGVTKDILSDFAGYSILGPNINKYNHALLLDDPMAALPKLIILHPDHQGDTGDGSIAFAQWNWGSNETLTGPDEQYNYPLWFKYGANGNLYDRFYASENPRVNGWKGMDFTIETAISCYILSNLDIDRPIETPMGKGMATLIELDFKNGKITINGTL